MIKSKLVLALALSVGLVGSAAAALTDMTVNGEKVPASRLEAVYNNAVKAGAKAGPELEARVKRDVTEEVVLLQEAAKAKIDRTKEYRDAIDRVGKQLKVELLVANYEDKSRERQRSPCGLRQCQEGLRRHRISGPPYFGKDRTGSQEHHSAPQQRRKVRCLGKI